MTVCVDGAGATGGRAAAGLPTPMPDIMVALATRAATEAGLHAPVPGGMP